MLCKSRKKVNKSQPQCSPQKKQPKHLSLSKSIKQLSMSFYHESTIRNNKQLILDNYPLDCTLDLDSNIFPTSQKNMGRRSSKKIKLPINNNQVFKEEPTQGKQKDEIDYTTTEASKINPHQAQGRRYKGEEKIKSIRGESAKMRDSRSRSKKVVEKYHKQLFLDMLQNRSRTSKGVFDLKQLWLKQKY